MSFLSRLKHSYHALLAIGAVSVLAGCATIGSASNGASAGGQQQTGGTATEEQVNATPTSEQSVVTPFEVSAARFEPLNPDQPNGPQISVLWGDPTSGPSASLFRFPRNYGGRFHTHTADYHLSLLEGTMKHWGEGQSEADVEELTLGGYWFQPGGQVHSDNCLTEYCIAFVKFEGPIDADYVE
jgi:hypothetical protein